MATTTPHQYYQRLAAVNHSQVYGQLGTTTKVALSTSNASSGSLAAGMYRVVLDVAGYVAMGGAATTSSAYFPAGSVEVYRLEAATTIQAILASGTGNMHITALTEPTVAV